MDTVCTGPPPAPPTLFHMVIYQNERTVAFVSISVPDSDKTLPVSPALGELFCSQNELTIKTLGKATRTHSDVVNIS